MLKPHIKEGVKGRAILIVPISECHISRAVFNFIVHVRYNRELESSEEIDDIWESCLSNNEFSEAMQKVLDLIEIR